MTVFILSSLINFGAFAFAPATVLVPLETLQYVNNIFFNRFINKVNVAGRVYLGVFLAIAGTILAVAGGPKNAFNFSELDLQQAWGAAGWIIYLIFAGSCLVGCFVLHKKLREQTGLAARTAAATGRPAPPLRTIEPIVYSLCWAQLGALMVTQSKVISELFKISGCEGTVPFDKWFFWISLLLVAVLGITWVMKMNEALGLYEPLFVIPVLQSTYIVLGVISGGIFFNEFATLSAGSWAMFVFGLLIVFCGLYFISPKSKSAPPYTANTEAAAAAAPPSPPLPPGGVAASPAAESGATAPPGFMQPWYARGGA
jgi:hypothetical protein